MKVVFSDDAWEQYLEIHEKHPKLVGKLHDLIKFCRRTPFEGLGEPEPLRGSLSGWWSRRITREHRLVYRVEGDELLIAQCLEHY